MTDDHILDEFRDADALLEGHFILSSGLRSPRYLQCARVLMHPKRAERLARALAAKLPTAIRESIDVVVSPAMGGVIIGHEMGRALGVAALFVERPEGRFELRRGFRLEPGQRVLMVEDVVTTSSTISTRLPGSIRNPRRSSNRPSGRSTNIAGRPSARPISWPMMTPPIAGDTTTSIESRILSGSLAASARASRSAREGFISTRAHCR
jgi:hypothetical protein